MTKPDLQLISAADDDEMVSLRDCAIELKKYRMQRDPRTGKEYQTPDTRSLLRKSRLGTFPPCLIVTSRHALVRRRLFEAWKEGRWTSTPAERAVTRDSQSPAVLDGEGPTNPKRRED